MINIKKFVFSLFAENTYIIWNDQSKECWVIDPGCYEPYEEEELSNFITTNELKVSRLINTHCHLDHIFGCKYVKEKYNPIYMIPEKDLLLLQHADKQAASFGVDLKKPPEPDEFLAENNLLSLDGSPVEILETPGHTPGEVCIYFGEENFCITGDVLFNGGIGRTDLWGGSYSALINSIKTKLLILPPETVIYPGHGPDSTIEYEKKHNLFLQD